MEMGKKWGYKEKKVLITSPPKKVLYQNQLPSYVMGLYKLDNVIASVPFRSGLQEDENTMHTPHGPGLI